MRDKLVRRLPYGFGLRWAFSTWNDLKDRNNKQGSREIVVTALKDYLGNMLRTCVVKGILVLQEAALNLEQNLGLVVTSI